MTKPAENEMQCPHCKTIIYRWYVRIHGNCPKCKKGVFMNETSKRED